jgi:hypothetical protein
MPTSLPPAETSLCPDTGEQGRRGLSRPRFVLAASMALYLAITAVLAVSQIGYLNADFVGYSTIAHRLLHDPRTSVTGYWSPLFSWCMAPLIYLGMDDLTAGRLVLVAAGVVYVLAAYRLVSRFHSVDERTNRLITVAVMTVAVMEAATWATRLLDPDLLADAILFCYFAAVLDPELPRKPLRAALAGALAGAAYLGKAYMLPFTLMHLPATLLMHWRASRKPGRDALCLRRCATAWIAFLAGQALMAGPWAGVLTSHYGKLTLSTAGPANHANMGPTAFGNDPLWNPGLTPDFIADPHYGPDWSATEDREHFVQQLKVVHYNANNCFGYVLPWIILGGIFAVAGRRKRAALAASEPTEPFGPFWCIVTVVLFCGGYCTINLETRYIVPVVTPLACLAAMLIVSDTLRSAGRTKESLRPRWRPPAMWAIPAILLVSVQDVNRMTDIPINHPQSARLAGFREIVDQLDRAQVHCASFAANRWHNGLYVSYAADDVPHYLGSPLPNSSTSMAAQLNASNSAAYLRWSEQDCSTGPESPLDAFVPAVPWTLTTTIRLSEPHQSTIEVYQRTVPSLATAPAGPAR